MREYVFPLWNCVYIADGKEDSETKRVEHRIDVVAHDLSEATMEAERITGLKNWGVIGTIVPIMSEGRHYEN